MGVPNVAAEVLPARFGSIMHIAGVERECALFAAALPSQGSAAVRACDSPTIPYSPLQTAALL